MSLQKRVVVGLSGGVDSSVAAALLLQQGYQVIGLFMKNWHDTSVTISSECPWLNDSNDALKVAEKLNIPFQVIDLSEKYKEKVVDYMFSEYEKGRTPNPDILCNREIKFDVFLEAALQLGADFVATGHYCRKDTIEKEGKNIYRLLQGKDPNKDQSYFLCQLSQYQLSKALFPIGDLLKPKVRQIASELELPTAEKPDSQGICFVGKVKLPDFLKQKLLPKQGVIVEIDNNFSSYLEKKPSPDLHENLIELSHKKTYSKGDGKVVGTHNGSHFFTIGQRKGLNVGGKLEPLFVIDTDTKENIIYVGEGKSHKGLYRSALFISKDEFHFIRQDITIVYQEKLSVKARIRYRQPLQEADIYCFEEGYYVLFKEPQSAITSGQFAAFYIDDELIASGVIF